MSEPTADDLALARERNREPLVRQIFLDVVCPLLSVDAAMDAHTIMEKIRTILARHNTLGDRALAWAVIFDSGAHCVHSSESEAKKTAVQYEAWAVPLYPAIAQHEQPTADELDMAKAIDRIDFDPTWVTSQERIDRIARLIAKHRQPDSRRTITLCGSTRFKRAWLEWNARLTIEGNVVFSVAMWSHDVRIEPTDEQKIILDEIHKAKIDRSDEIFVLDVGGYIGSSTQSEIEHAERTGKVVRYLSREFPDWKEDDCVYAAKHRQPPPVQPTADERSLWNILHELSEAMEIFCSDENGIPALLEVDRRLRAWARAHFPAAPPAMTIEEQMAEIDEKFATTPGIKFQPLKKLFTAKAPKGQTP